MNGIPMKQNFIPNPPSHEQLPDHIKQELEYYRNHEAFKKPEFAAVPMKQQIEVSKTVMTTAPQATEIIPLAEQQNQQLFEEVRRILTPESHDENMAVVFSFMQLHGVAKTLSLIEGLHNPHIEDDFHRFLVQYVQTYLKQNGAEPIIEKRFFEPTHKSLLEITIQPDHQGEKINHKSLAATMEQIYSSFSSIKCKHLLIQCSYFQSLSQILFL